jgi:DNA repair exonuclease SbcCD ATPase subunit
MNPSGKEESTMTRKRDLQSLVAKYRRLAAAVQAHEGEIPALARFRVELQATLEEIAAAKNRQANLEALRREATQDLRGRVAAGEDAAARLTSFLRAIFGRDRERLEAFGINLGGRHLTLYEKTKGGNDSPGYH